jgi:hypothetical protein
MWKWQLQQQMELSWKQQESWGASSDRDTDEIKRMLTETDPWLLGLTMVVSVLHSVFDFLAFKNDIAFWKSNKSVEGISVRTIFINLGTQTVIFLYLFDNETSWMILASSFVGLLIEAWKINRAADVTVEWVGRLPRIRIQDKSRYRITHIHHHPFLISCVCALSRTPYLA